MTDLEPMELGSPGPLRDRLIAAVLAGEKTATSSLLAQYEDACEPLPRPGERKLLVDSSEAPVGLVEIIEVEVIRLGDAEPELALDEGEGLTSVAEWRRAHEEFWRREVLPELTLSLELDDDTDVVVERFRYLGGA